MLMLAKKETLCMVMLLMTLLCKLRIKFLQKFCL